MLRTKFFWCFLRKDQLLGFFFFFSVCILGIWECMVDLSCNQALLHLLYMVIFNFLVIEVFSFFVFFDFLSKVLPEASFKPLKSARVLARHILALELSTLFYIHSHTECCWFFVWLVPFFVSVLELLGLLVSSRACADKSETGLEL